MFGDLSRPALIAAGVIGVLVAVIHGVLTQRLMVTPIAAHLHADRSIKAPIRQLVPALLQFSTFNWLVGGIALIWAAGWLDADGQRATGLLVGSSYLYGAACNLRATRARHPGGWLYLLAVALIIVGVA